MATQKSVHVLITGKVQGVGYRSWLQREAVAPGLSGWVRNRRCGAVEAVFDGPGEIIEAMIEACRTGPRWARVTDIEIETSLPPVPAGFHIKEDE